MRRRSGVQHYEVHGVAACGCERPGVYAETTPNTKQVTCGRCRRTRRHQRDLAAHEDLLRRVNRAAKLAL